MVRHVVFGIKADTDKPHVFGQRDIVCAEIVKLTEDARKKRGHAFGAAQRV